MSKWIEEDEVDRAIALLTADPDVKLARAEMRMKYRKRQYLYQPRNLKKRGEELRRAGVTNDSLYDIEDRIVDDHGCEDDL